MGLGRFVFVVFMRFEMQRIMAVSFRFRLQAGFRPAIYQRRGPRQYKF